MSRSKIVDHYLAKLDDPAFEIIQIRRELKQAGVAEEEISIIFRIIDNEMQRRLHQRQRSAQAANLKLMGLFIFSIGFLITIGTYTGIMPTGSHYVLMYGPMGFGITLFLYGLAGKDGSGSKFRKK